MTERSEVTPQERLAEIEEQFTYSLSNGDIPWLVSRVKALEARNARLTEALEEIKEYRCSDVDGCMDIARKALLESERFCADVFEFDQEPKDKIGYIHVKQVLPGEDEMIQELVEALEYIANSIPGPEQMFELENKRAGQEALDKYKKWLEK